MQEDGKNAARKTIYVIDGNSYIYRAFYAIRGLTTSSGLPCNAVLGFANMLFKVLRERNPDHIAIAFDPKGPTRRHREYEAYKAQRPPMPKDLVPQIPYIHRLVEALRIPVFIQEGQEADDVIASIALQARTRDIDVCIITGDKDILQLVRPGITVYDSLKDKTFGPAEVEERFGVPPDRIVDVMGLMGDAADNIPGVPGIGEKTAQALIRQYGSLENVLARASEITKPKLRQTLLEQGARARLSFDLARLHTDLPIQLDLEALRPKEPDNPALLALLRELEFTSLLKHVAAGQTVHAEYRTILTRQDLADLVAALSSADGFSFDTETTSLDPLRAQLVGISFSLMPNTASYIPVGHSYEGAPVQLDIREVLHAVKPVMADPSIAKTGQNMKYDILVLSRYDIAVQGTAFDTMIASYLLNPSKTSHSLDAIALEYLNYRTTTYADVTGTGKKQIGFDKVAIDTAARYSGEDADIALRLSAVLGPQLSEHGLTQLFRDIEMPLLNVLVDMERAGIKVDVPALRAMSVRLEKELARRTTVIHELAGGEFNINSPKQLSEILFDRLGLRPVKRTKTGFSTDMDVLQELAASHPLPAEILAYRSLAKLKSTYVDTLPTLVHPDTGRIHTSFNQTVTATGRLSSSDPNLQNIPVRTEIGREIRKAFIAEPGASLLSADYSQVELRILAHLSGDRGLIQTFLDGEDIHARTASEIFDLPREEITAEMRRKAKAVNFGIIYGISAFGLAQDIGVSNAEAKRYIDSYFHRYPKVREFIDATVASARTNGYVTTLLGRRRFIPELASNAAAVRSFGERTAVNTPIQGTAADLIKLAMIHIHQTIRERRLSARMILQVHDELVFEAPDGEIDRLRDIVREGMETVLRLDVPIVVGMAAGKNWDDAH